MGGDRVSTSEAMRIAQTEDEHLSIGCDVRHGNGYTVLTSDVCRDMWDANHVRQVDLECDADLSAFIARMETLFRQINREHCKFELDFRTRPQQLAAVLRRRGYVCTRGVVQVYRGATTRIAAERIAAERVAAEGRNASGGIGADRLPSDMVEIEITARSGQSRLADWAALEHESYSVYDSGTGFADRATQLSRHRLECAWKSGQDLQVFLATTDGGRESAGKRGSGADRHAGAVVGACELFRRHGVAKIEGLYVTPAARGSGMGAALLSRALISAIAAGDDLVYLVAAADDWPRHMYTRFGFVDLMETHSWLKMLDQDAHQTDFLVW
jgi:GNAT superfamily N-acetyltransferase